MAALQAALDDWYAMELAEAERSLNADVPPTGSGKGRLEKEKAEALKGLGNPKDGGAAAKKQQRENAGKDVKDPKNKGKKPKDTLKEKIAKTLKDLQECEEKCPMSENTGTPTPTATPEDKKTEIPNPPPFETEVPPLPPCFKTKEARAAHRKTLEELQPKLGYLRKQYAGEYLTPPVNDAWKAWGEKLKKAMDDVNDQLGKVDTVPVPCPTPTPTPRGGGPAKTPTATPKGKPKKAPRVTTGGNVSYGGGPMEDFCTEISDNKIKVDITGTGETIGHIADARISNLTDEPIAFTIPPAVLESHSGKNQNYGIPRTTDVALKPHESKTVPLDGVCLDRHKPPVGKGIGDDLAFNDCDPDGRIPHDRSDRMLRIAETVYQAADELEEDGKLKEIPYKDPKKRKEIVEQWATWVRISEVTGDPPPTKDDLKKVVEKQVGKVPPDKQKKIDDGIDTIFEKIELTTEKAKDLDKAPSEEASPANTGENISNDTPTPQPGTQEKKKKEGKKKKDKKKKYPPEIQKWLDDYDTWIEWASKRNMAEFNYKTELKKWALEHSPHYKELNDAVKKAADKINDANKNGGKATQEDWDNLKKAQQELEKNEKEVGKDFQKTEPGKALYKEFIDAEDIANKAKTRADESGKGIDEDLKKEILEKERD